MTMPPLPPKDSTSWYTWASAVHDKVTTGANGVVTVQHGTNANFVRPSIGTGTVRWVGSVQPNAMTTTDVWVQTAPLQPPLTTAAWLGAWYADDLVASGMTDNATVASWRDASGHGLPLTPTAEATGNAVLRTAAVGYNGQPAVKFTTSPLASPAMTSPLAAPYTMVMVANIGANPSEETLFRNPVSSGTPSALYVNNGGPWGVSPSGPANGSHVDTSPHLFIVTFTTDATIGALQVDGVKSGGAFTDPAPITKVRLGMWDTTTAYMLSGSVAFAAVINGALTSDQVSSLQTWAQSKYAISMP